MFPEHKAEIEKYKLQLVRKAEDMGNIGCGLYDIMDELAENWCIDKVDVNIVSNNLRGIIDNINLVISILDDIIKEDENEND